MDNDDDTDGSTSQNNNQDLSNYTLESIKPIYSNIGNQYLKLQNILNTIFKNHDYIVLFCNNGDNDS